MMQPTSRHIWAVVLVIAAVASTVSGAEASLPIAPLVAVGLVLLLLAAALLRSSDSAREGDARFWVLLVVGALFLAGGALGLIRSFMAHRGWAAGAPLAIPLALGLYSIWVAFRVRQRASHEG